MSEDEQGHQEEKHEQQPPGVDEGDDEGGGPFRGAANLQRKLHVAVIVLGDVGRSPRMQYHALSLLQAGHDVSLVGYAGEKLIQPLQQQQQEQQQRGRLNVVRFTPLPCPEIVKAKLTPLYFLWRVLSLSFGLLWALLAKVKTWQSRVDCLLVQNPPALPSLLVAYIFCRLQGTAALVIDWHNLGYSMLHDGSAYRRLAETFEVKMAPHADGHLTVTKAMKDFVEKHMLDPAGIDNGNNIRVLYDRPAEIFQPLSMEEQHQILSKLDRQLRQNVPKSWLDFYGTESQHQTLFTERFADDNGKCLPRQGRPALITSSTSWTPDEDFGILLDALIILDDRIRTQESRQLRVVVVVTGKGPEKQYYEQKISRLKLESVAVLTLWLEPGDYPKLLACADVGVCLHTSTSGLDLPMKVLDLFGCHVPVCAVNFACLSELVLDRVNGRVFGTSSQLANHLWELLLPCAVGGSSSLLACHSYGALKEYSSQLQNQKRWKENWMENALPVILSAVEKANK